MLQRPPRVSIAVPVFNGEAYLAEALECLATQSLHDIEVIILDNCSTDRTNAIAAEFVARDSRFRLVRHARNIGMMPNFIAGLREARGEYFMWRAFDDLSDPRYIETLAATLDARPEAALASPRVRMVNMDGTNERWIDFPRVDGGALVNLIRLMFRSHAGWFYGLWRRAALEQPFLDAMTLSNFAWGNDHLALLPFLLRREVAFAADAVFHQRLKKSAGAPKRRNPVGADAMLGARRDFTRCYRALVAAYGPRASLTRLALWAALPLYRERRCYRLGQVLRAAAG